MSRFLYNTSRAVLTRLLELERETGEPWSREAAAVSLLLDADANRVRGQRTYACQWGWTYSAVRWSFSEVKAEAARLATADGRQPDTPLASRVPDEWMQAAGLNTNDAVNGLNGAREAESQRTPESDGEEQRISQRSSDALHSAQNGSGGAEMDGSRRTPQRTSSAPHSAHLTIPHPSSSHPTDQPERVGGSEPDGSVGGVEKDHGSLIASVVATLREAGEDDPRIEGKVSALIRKHGSDLVRRQLDGIIRQQRGKPFGFGFLRSAVEDPDRFVFELPRVQLVKGETYGDRQRTRAIEGGTPTVHFHSRGTDDRGQPLWMYLPDGPHRSEAADNLNRARGDGQAGTAPEMADHFDRAPT